MNLYESISAIVLSILELSSQSMRMKEPVLNRGPPGWRRLAIMVAIIIIWSWWPALTLLALFGTGGFDSGIKMEKTGHHGGQNYNLVMVASHQWPCLELVVWTVESRWRRLAIMVALIIIWS